METLKIAELIQKETGSLTIVEQYTYDVYTTEALSKVFNTVYSIPKNYLDYNFFTALSEGWLPPKHIDSEMIQRSKEPHPAKTPLHKWVIQETENFLHEHFLDTEKSCERHSEAIKSIQLNGGVAYVERRFKNHILHKKTIFNNIIGLEQKHEQTEIKIITDEMIKNSYFSKQFLISSKPYKRFEKIYLDETGIYVSIIKNGV